MLEASNQPFEDLDKALEELEYLVEQERKQNQIINNRILEKEAILNSLEVELYNN